VLGIANAIGVRPETLLDDNASDLADAPAGDDWLAAHELT
jgi:hypothetical protein